MTTEASGVHRAGKHGVQHADPVVDRYGLLFLCHKAVNSLGSGTESPLFYRVPSLCWQNALSTSTLDCK